MTEFGVCSTLVSEIQGRLVPWPDPSHTMARVQYWASTCRNKHTATCRHYRAQVVAKPSRLLDIRDGHVIKLVEVDGNNNKHRYEYATVSHRWDDTVLMLTTQEQAHQTLGLDDQVQGPRRILVQTLQEAGHPVQDLSPVFQKAVQIARTCGLDYLWIDSLCIIQDEMGDSGHNPDWETEVKKMGDIYAGGVL